MNTIREKTRYDIVRAAAVQRTAAAFGVGENYVRQIIRGVTPGVEILNYYSIAYKEIKAVVAPQLHGQAS